jgi:prophage antirepressor-like protein
LNYLTHEIRAYVGPDGAAWLVLVDLFRAIGHRRNSPLRKRITAPKDIMKVLAWVPNAANPMGGGGAMIQATNEKGLLLMLSVRDEKAIALYEWLIATGLPGLRAGR